MAAWYEMECVYRSGRLQLGCGSRDTVVSLGGGYDLCASHARKLLLTSRVLTAQEREILGNWWQRGTYVR